MSKITDLESKLNTKIEETIAVVDKKKFDQKEHDAKTRSEIALKFTNWYFGLLTLVIIISFTYGLINLFTGKNLAELFKLQDGILAVSTAIGSPLGFVIGYYFKEGERK